MTSYTCNYQDIYLTQFNYIQYGFSNVFLDDLIGKRTWNIVYKEMAFLLYVFLGVSLNHLFEKMILNILYM